MDFYSRKNLWKFFLFLFAILIGVITLLYTESFLKDLRNEELKKVNLWANAMAKVQQATENTDLTLVTEILRNNTTIPVIITNDRDSIIVTRNIELPKTKQDQFLRNRLEEMKDGGSFIEADFQQNQPYIVYYEDSTILTKLRIYPIVLLVVISLFILIAYFAFSGARKAEQNQVWNGLAKETAHQIGTPLSSLMGWLELLKMQEIDPSIPMEMEKDIKRLETITNRFSKIGSQPALKETDLVFATKMAVDYLRNRSPKKIEVNCDLPREPLYTFLNKPLFEWVIENLIRNAIDAIEGPGTIRVSMEVKDAKWLQIDVQDSGKGISAAKLKTVFRPGFSTKKRGWGLGLSLAKRIIEQYHQGKIFVASSSLNEGTTFRILLPKLP